jgi:dienelactone hydrolase family protein
MREIAAGRGRTFDDIDAVRGWLSSDDRCTSRIGVIGFCMGGAYAVALAPGRQRAGGDRYPGRRDDAVLIRARAAGLNAGDGVITRGVRYLMRLNAGLRRLRHGSGGRTLRTRSALLARTSPSCAQVMRFSGRASALRATWSRCQRLGQARARGRQWSLWPSCPSGGQTPACREVGSKAPTRVVDGAHVASFEWQSDEPRLPRVSVVREVFRPCLTVWPVGHHRVVKMSKGARVTVQQPDGL